MTDIDPAAADEDDRTRSDGRREADVELAASLLAFAPRQAIVMPLAAMHTIRRLARGAGTPAIGRNAADDLAQRSTSFGAAPLVAIELAVALADCIATLFASQLIASARRVAAAAAIVSMPSSPLHGTARRRSRTRRRTWPEAR